MLLLLLLLLSSSVPCARCNWDEWWTYDGISGPSYWGVINPAWRLCAKGRSQSPVDIRPSSIVYDWRLSPLRVEKAGKPGGAGGVLYNTGQSLTFKVETKSDLPVNISGGPLTYSYQFEQLYVHWCDENSSNGSEHSLSGHFFPAEIQLMGFNSELFDNLSQALGKPHGAVGIAVMVQETERLDAVNDAFRLITQHLRKVTYRGQNYPLPNLDVAELVPSTDGFLTYEGSSTAPGCEEGVTWVLMNRPIYMSALELTALRGLKQGERTQPKSPVAPNARPVQRMNGRVVRTNVAVDGSGSSSSRKKKKCPNVAKDMKYKPNLGWSN